MIIFNLNNNGTRVQKFENQYVCIHAFIEPVILSNQV